MQQSALHNLQNRCIEAEISLSVDCTCDVITHFSTKYIYTIYSLKCLYYIPMINILLLHAYFISFDTYSFEFEIKMLILMRFAECLSVCNSHRSFYALNMRYNELKHRFLFSQLSNTHITILIAKSLIYTSLYIC